MSTFTRSAIDADGQRVDVFTTDDPAEGGGATLQEIVAELEGTLEVTDDGAFAVDTLPPLPSGTNNVGSVDIDNQSAGMAEESTQQSIDSAIGDESSAQQVSDSSVPATLIERVTALVDTLTSGQADDEVRVALAADLLTGSLDVNLDAQTGNIAVELAADSLSGNLDVDLAEATAEPLDVSGATVPTEQQTPIQLESSSGANIDPATEGTLSDLRDAAQALDDALESNGTDTLRISTPQAIDASASEIDVDLSSLSFGTLPVEQQSPVGVEDSQGTQVDPATSGDVGAVEEAIGDESVAAQEADSAVAATLLERLTAVVDALTSGQADDELRVALADDLLSGDLDVNLNAQNGDLTVTLDGESITVDSLPSLPAGGNNIGSVNVDGQPIGVSVDEQTGDLSITLDGESVDVSSLPDVTIGSWSAGTLPTEQQTPIGIEDPNGTQKDPASDPAIKGGASLQDIIDAVDQSALAQIAATEEGTLLTDATTAQSTPTQTNAVYKGVIVWVNIDSISGTSPSLTAKIQRQSPGGVWQDVLSTGSLTSSGLTTLQVHPSVPDVSNERAGELLGRDWRVDVTLDTADGDESYQYDIEYTYIE